MYFKFARRSNLLSINDDYAHLSRVLDNGNVVFDLFYKISPGEAVTHEALTVNVTVISRTIKPPPIFDGSTTGHIDTKKLVNNILTNMSNAKSALKQQEQYTVAFKSSDITSKINNEVVGQLRARVPAKDIQQLIKPVMKVIAAGDLKESAENKPVFQMTAHSSIANVSEVHSASLAVNSSKLIHDMIIRQGVDPSHITQLTHRSLSSVDVVGGILRSSKANEAQNSPLSKLLNHHMFTADVQFRPATSSQLQDDDVLHVLSFEPETHVEVPVSVVVPQHALRDGNSHFFVKFELINSRSGVAIDTVTKSLDVARHLQLYNTPKRPPVVKVIRSEVSTRANIEIKQIDEAASSVLIYKKNIFRAVTDIDDYTLIGTYDVRNRDQALLVQVDMPRNSTAIYRVVPVGQQGTMGFEYTNVVIRPTRFKQIKSLALVARSIDIGVRLEATHIPQDVVAVEFKARNMTTFEREYRNVGGGVIFIDESVRASDHIDVIDNNVSPNNVYEYVARLIYESGTDELTGNETVEFIKPTPNKVATNISELTIDYDGDEPNTTFDVTTTIVDTNIDIVKALLQRQDIYDMFKDDVAKEREFLKSLIAHNIQRVDLTSGRRDDFGIVTTTSFNDNELRKNLSIGPLQLGHRYRYEVTALLRAPETMFETLQKVQVDSITKKTFMFNPAKFHHPIALSTGTIVTAAGLRTRFSKDAMSHGRIGQIEVVEASFDEEPAHVVEAEAARFDKYTNIITWKLKGSIDQVDHFVIMKDANGVRTVIGKAHSEFQHGRCQYVHPVSRRDEGAFSYVIAPVFNNYKTGPQVTTDVVLTEQLPVTRKNHV